MTGMNRSIKRVAIAVLVMFLILLVDVNYLQAVQAPSLANRPLNDRTEYEQNQVQRGNIVTADGVKIATSIPSANGLFKWQRVYSGPRDIRACHRLRHHLHPVPGAELRRGRRTGGERAADRHRVAARVPQLHRHDHQQAAEGRDRPGHGQLRGPEGGLRQSRAGTARQDLNGKQQVGGVVALNPSTGAILAMASYPSFDPNELAVHDRDALNSKVHAAQPGKPPSPLINNAFADHAAARLDVQDRHELRLVHPGLHKEHKHGGRLAAAA